MIGRASRFAWLGLLLGARAAYAQELDLGAIEDVEALSLSELLEQPVTAASRYAERPGDSPSIVSTVDHDTIHRFGFRSLAEVLASMRGLYTSNDRNYGYLGVRGFSAPGDYNTRVVLSIDGHRINDLVYQQGTTGLELGLPIQAIERVEMVRGGAWTVHGENALLGAIGVVTASGATRPGLRVTSTTRASLETFEDPADRSKFASRGEDVAATYGAVSRGYDVFVAGAYSYDPGLAAIYMPELARAEDEPCRDLRGQQQVCTGVIRGGDAEEVGSLFAAVKHRGVALRAFAAGRLKDVPTAPFGSLIGGPMTTLDARMFADLSYTRATPHSDVVLRGAIDEYLYRAEYLYAGSEGVADATRYVDVGRGRWLTAEARGRYKIPSAGPHVRDIELAGTVDGRTGVARQIGGDEAERDYTDDIDRADRVQVIGAGGHVRARLFDHVVVFGAVRSNYHPDSFGLTTNPQIGMLLDGGSLGRIRASYGRGYRAPNPYEQYWGPTTSGTPIPELQPEQSATRELSLERYLGDHMRLLVVGFDQRVTDLIGLTTGDDGLAVYGNSGEVRSRGLELELEGRWDRLRLHASYTTQHVRNADGRTPANAPGTLANFMLLAPIAGGRAEIGVQSQFIDERLAFDGTGVPPIFMTHLVTTVHDVAQDLDLSFGVWNAFDQRGGSPGSEEHRQSIIPQDPRTVWIRLALELDP